MLMPFQIQKNYWKERKMKCEAQLFMKRVIEKTIALLRYMKLWVIYKPKGLVTVLGKVYLNNPNIRFGSNVTLYPNVHILDRAVLL